MEIFLSNAYYMCAKNTTNPHCKECERFSRISSNKLDWSSSSKLLFEATSIFSFTIPPTEEKKKNAARTCKHCSEIKSIKNRGMGVCSVLINQQCALIQAFACFIRTLVCSKKKHQVLKTNNLLSNNAFCILELFYSSDFVFGKMNYK